MTRRHRKGRGRENFRTGALNHSATLPNLQYQAFSKGEGGTKADNCHPTAIRHCVMGNEVRLSRVLVMETFDVRAPVHPTSRGDRDNRPPRFGEPIPRHFGFREGVEIHGLSAVVHPCHA